MKRIQLQLTNKRKERHIFTLDLVKVPSGVRVTVLDPGYKLQDGKNTESRLELPLNSEETDKVAIVPATSYTKKERYFVIVSGALAARG